MTDDRRLRLPPKFITRARDFRRPLTPMEARLWARLRERRCERHKFRRQVELGSYIADFVCAEAKLIVEADGASHNATIERDTVRNGWLTRNGYHILRVTNYAVRDSLEGVLLLIAKACAEYGSVQEPNTSTLNTSTLNTSTLNTSTLNTSTLIPGPSPCMGEGSESVNVIQTDKGANSIAEFQGIQGTRKSPNAGKVYLNAEKSTSTLKVYLNAESLPQR